MSASEQTKRDTTIDLHLKSLAEWRDCRNTVVAALAAECKLTPTQITQLRHRDLYRNQQPIEVLKVPNRVAGPGKTFKVTLSAETRQGLAAMNHEPFLLTQFPLMRPLFSSRPGQPQALSTRQVNRILATSASI